MNLKPFEKTVLDSKSEYSYEGEKLNEERNQLTTGPSVPNTSAKNIDVLLSNSQKSNNSKTNDFDMGDEFNEEEVDELINWTKNIVS